METKEYEANEDLAKFFENLKGFKTYLEGMKDTESHVGITKIYERFSKIFQI